MDRDTTGREPVLSRRTLLVTTSGVLAGTVALGLVGPAGAGQRHPQRGGVLRFATRADAAGLDPHRYLLSPVSVPLAATVQGLLDLNLHAEPVPGIASEWDASPDLQTYSFTLRRDVLFHNGREVDSTAVQWNFARMQHPKTSHPFIRSTLLNLKATEVVDRSTVRFHLHQPSAGFPADVVSYPCSLIAPESTAQAERHPIGCGPF
jgi:peptide/nickel transport system substrate-binding protein